MYTKPFLPAVRAHWISCDVPSASLLILIIPDFLLFADGLLLFEGWFAVGRFTWDAATAFADSLDVLGDATIFVVHPGLLLNWLLDATSERGAARGRSGESFSDWREWF